MAATPITFNVFKSGETDSTSFITTLATPLTAYLTKSPFFTPSKVTPGPVIVPEVPLLEPSVIVNKVIDGKDSFGFNAATSEFGDMIEMGILDPAKVTRTALQAAGSVAGMMITTEAMVTDVPKDDTPMPPMPDMGGMGGMGGMM